MSTYSDSAMEDVFNSRPSTPGSEDEIWELSSSPPIDVISFEFQMEGIVDEHPPTQQPLSRFEDMALDIIIEILPHLSINDLWHLSRTSAVLCRFLTAPDIAKYWEQALGDYKDAPPKRPEGLSVRSFIDLMFGSHCQNCCKAPSDDNPMITMYHLHRRLCKTCYRSKMISYSEGFRTWILPETFRLAPFHRESYTEPRRFFFSDLTKFQEEYLKEVEIAEKSPNKEKHLHEYKLRCYGERTKKKDSYQVYEKWHVESNQRRCSILMAQIMPPKACGFKERFISISCDPLYSFEWGFGDPFSNRRPRMSQEFQKILEDAVKREVDKIDGRSETFSKCFIGSVRRKVEEQIDLYKTAERVKQERFMRIVEDRRQIACEAFMDAISKATWHGRLLLRQISSDFADYLLTSASFSDIIRQKETVKVTKDDFKEPMKKWEAILQDFVFTKSMLVRELEDRVMDTLEEENLTSLATTMEILQGAFTSTFSCRECARSKGQSRILLGSQEIVLHRHDPQLLLYNIQAALNLQSLLPDNQQCIAWTAEELRAELDKADGRFVCMNCPQQWIDGVRMVAVMSWRQCVEHVCVQSSQPPSPKWRALTSDEAHQVKEIEASRYSEGDDEAYQCALCLPSANPKILVPEPKKKCDVFRHLEEMHKRTTETLRLGEDYILDPRYSERGALAPATLVPCEGDSKVGSDAQASGCSVIKRQLEIATSPKVKCLASILIVSCPFVWSEVPTHEKPSPQVDNTIERLRAVQRGESRFENLALDIVIEILSYLSINDLWYLSTTSAVLCRFLTSPNFETSWERALKEFKDAPPERPEGLSVRSFVDLMFGNRCQNCCKHTSRENPVITTYYLHRRYCRSCYRTKTVSYSEGLRTWILPETFRLAPFHREFETEPRRFFVEDLTKFQEEYLKEVAIAENSPNKEKHLYEYKLRCFAERAKKKESYQVYENWHVKINKRRCDILGSHVRHNLESGFGDLSADGRLSGVQEILEVTVKQEVNKIEGRSEMFSDFFINSVTRKVEEEIKTIDAVERVRKERSMRIVDDRKQLAWEAFMDATANATWMGHLLLRRISSDFEEYLSKLSRISDIIHQKKSAKVSKDDFKEIMKEWETILQDFLISKTISVLLLAERVKSTLQEENLTVLIGKVGILKGSFTSTFSCLECARSEGRPRILLGKEEIVFHRHDPGYLSFDTHAALKLRSLLPENQQNQPRTLKELRAQLDEADGRFVCLNCPQQCVDGVSMVSAMSWRQCVEHVCILGPRLLPPTWRALQSGEERKVKEIETSRQHEDVYQCALCLPSANPKIPVPEPKKKSDLFRHLDEIHKRTAETLRLGKDYIVDPRYSERGALAPVTLVPCEGEGKAASDARDSGYRVM